MPRVTQASTKARRVSEIQARKQSVLEAARTVFAASGYPSAATDDIAVQAGVSVGTVYNFFASKEILFARTVESIGDEVLAGARVALEAGDSLESCVREIVRLRLAGYERQRLFFMVASDAGVSGAYPVPEAISERIMPLYYRYLDLVAKVLKRGVGDRSFEKMTPLSMAISMEGIINGFASYWTRPGVSQPLDRHVGQVTETLLRVFALNDRTRSVAGSAAVKRGREVYITRFDFERLRELISVARTFGGSDQAAHLDELAHALARARIVDARAVPQDVCTMNSRVRLRNIEKRIRRVVTLSFPADAGTQDRVSVLEPLGTALLGGRVGAAVAVAGRGVDGKYEIIEMLYQPESAGHYHL